MLCCIKEASVLLGVHGSTPGKHHWCHQCMPLSVKEDKILQCTAAYMQNPEATGACFTCRVSIARSTLGSL